MADARPTDGAAPQVSVLMAVRNGAGTIRAAVESILGQTMTDLELVVVDDASDDATPRLLERLAEDPRVVVRTAPHRLGTAGARNLALEIARADLVAIADADDVSRRDRLALQVERFRSDPELVAVGGQMAEFGDWGRRARSYRFPESREAIHRAFLRNRMGVAHAAAMFRRGAALEVGGYDTACARSEDLALFRKLASRPMVAVPEQVVDYRVPRSIGLRYVWREMYWSVLAERRNPLGADRSNGPERLGPAGTLRAVAWTLRSWTIRRTRELLSHVRGSGAVA